MDRRAFIALLGLAVTAPVGVVAQQAPTARIGERAGGVLVLASAFFSTHSQRIVGLAARTRLPAIYEHQDFVEPGGLMSYGPSHRDMFGRLAVYVDRILKGAKPGDLPVEQPTKLELVINLKAARALGLGLPQSLLARADRIIE
jgi:putative ABC transport system substrate-binding protein